jgi:hypothetical protein
VLPTFLTRHNWAYLVVSVFLLLEFMRGLRTGRTIWIYRTVTRRDDGYLYWWAIGIELIAGAAGLIISVTRMAS